MTSPQPQTVSTHRQVLNLAVPAFLSLIAEPLFLMADSAVIGHIGTVQLAGLGVASTVLTTATGLFVFLAYATTAASARRMGAGDRAGAAQAGIDGAWLSIIIGVLVAALLVFGAPVVVGLFGTEPAAAGPAVEYLRIAGVGIPAMLVTMAVTGVLRGFQDTRTPLVVTVVAFSVNLALNLWFVLGLGWGIAGSAWGTLICQVGMALALVIVFVVRTRGAGASLRFQPAGVLGSLRDGIPLLIRTLALRISLLVTTWVAARLGVVALASYQVSMTVWNFLTMALDALGIAGQALTGASLGSGDRRRTRELTTLMVKWGAWVGVVLGAGVLALHRVLPVAFSQDPAVRAAMAAGLIVIAVMQPLSGVVFVLDGVLIGAGDGRWLSGAQVVMLVAYLPMILGVFLASPTGSAGVVWLWTAFGGFMLVRGLILAWRGRGDAWMRLGA
ncbi:MATE family efflux transporter [Acidipropionibacterium acidipropionici]|uniref:MATE family efflux transporter n=1 Tax=Acidipropionibacterium acidipropionici TaxID=1748 RepID=UPI000418626D|nr:MATE family efflux transporter [Acidipropionibacterium acidipropionici]ALN14866.1 MATE family efflux transporter [Acidipropionibacterium acidipropionici]APZ09381.1 MATE family efflux transporter [Acidipropionibacterium acidipropionici]